MNNEAKEKELIELRIKLMNADRFIKVHNDPMAAQQVITNCMQQVNNMLEACEGMTDAGTESKCNKQNVNVSKLKTRKPKAPEPPKARTVNSKR